MPFDGNGIYNPLTPPIFPAVSGTTITANQYNQQILDLGSALSNCITRDGQSPPTTDIPMNNHKLTGLLAPTLGGDAANKTYVDGQVSSGNTTTLNAAKSYSDAALQLFTQLRNLRGVRTSTSVVTWSCDAVRLRNVAGQVLSVAGGSVAVDKNLAGPAALGRDQFASFGNNTWIYGYYIYGIGPGLTGVWSLSNSAPTLFGSYTHYALVTAAYIDSSGNLQLYYQRGNEINYNVIVNSIVSSSAGGDLVLTNFANLVPTIALKWSAQGVINCTASAAGQYYATVGFKDAAGGIFLKITNWSKTGLVASSAGLRDSLMFDNIPYTTAPVYNQALSPGAAITSDVYCTGFILSNGAC